MARLKEEGKVRHIGVSNFNVAQMKRAMAIAPITTLQPPYSMLARGVEESILPFAAANNIGVIVYSPMYSGLLSGGMTRQRIASLAKRIGGYRTQTSANLNSPEIFGSSNCSKRLVHVMAEPPEKSPSHGR